MLHVGCVDHALISSALTFPSLMMVQFVSIDAYPETFHAIKVLGVPPTHIPSKADPSSNPSAAAAAVHSEWGGCPLGFALVAVSGPVNATSSRARG
jgi:hypothetical protein